VVLLFLSLPVKAFLCCGLCSIRVGCASPAYDALGISLWRWFEFCASSWRIWLFLMMLLTWNISFCDWLSWAFGSWTNCYKLLAVLLNGLPSVSVMCVLRSAEMNSSVSLPSFIETCVWARFWKFLFFANLRGSALCRFNLLTWPGSLGGLPELFLFRFLTSWMEPL